MLAREMFESLKNKNKWVLTFVRLSLFVEIQNWCAEGISDNVVNVMTRNHYIYQYIIIMCTQT